MRRVMRRVIIMVMMNVVMVIPVGQDLWMLSLCYRRVIPRSCMRRLLKPLDSHLFGRYHHPQPLHHHQLLPQPLLLIRLVERVGLLRHHPEVLLHPLSLRLSILMM